MVHADETGWRENGVNGYAWTFSTPTERYFLRRGRGKEVVDKALGEFFSGVLVSDFYAAYHHYDITTAPSSGAGPTCCGTSMTSAPSTPMMRHWPGGPTPSTGFTTRPKPSLIPRPSGSAPPNWPWNGSCWTSASPSGMTQRRWRGRLCRRIERHIKELFIFVVEPAVPADNNAAERSLRHLVISRKVRGGTRSEQGTERKMTLASIFGTWRAQGLNPLTACRQLLVSPQL